MANAIITPAPKATPTHVLTTVFTDGSSMTEEVALDGMNFIGGSQIAWQTEIRLVDGVVQYRGGSPTEMRCVPRVASMAIAAI